MREDSFVSSTGPDQFSEMAIFSGSDSETQGPTTPSQDFSDQPSDSALPDSEPPPTSVELPPSDENHVNHAPSEVCDNTSNELHLDTDVLSTVSEPVEPVEEVNTSSVKESSEPVQEEKEVENLERSTSEPSPHPAARRSTSILSRKSSSDSLSVSILADK